MATLGSNVNASHPRVDILEDTSSAQHHLSPAAIRRRFQNSTDTSTASRSTTATTASTSATSTASESAIAATSTRYGDGPGQRSKYKHVAAIHYMARPSVLSHDSPTAPSFLGFRNLMVIVLGMWKMSLAAWVYCAGLRMCNL